MVGGRDHASTCTHVGDDQEHHATTSRRSSIRRHWNSSMIRVRAIDSRIAYVMFSVNRAFWDVQVRYGITYCSVNVTGRWMTIVSDLFHAACLSRTLAEGVLGHVVEAQATKVDSRCPPWSANALWCRASVDERSMCVRGEMSTMWGRARTG